jgi:hypothetical protein
MAEASSAVTFRLGQRVRAADNLALASVRYLGPVQVRSGELSLY